MRSTRILFLAALAALSACSGPNPVRLRAERANHALAVRCADGWFRGLPFTPHDEQLVRQALADWDRSLQAEERLVAAPIGEPR